ncbi:MAG: chemotaxis protein CheW [Thermodesulfobacteriota bacterium]
MPVDPSSVRILLAEDAMAMRKIEIKILNSLGFKQVVEAKDGAEAIRILQNEPGIGLIISDWNMPNKSGLDLLKWVRASEKGKNLPFIMATGQSDKGQEQKAVEAGVSCFVPKPFSAEELQRKIDEAFGDRPAEERKETGPQFAASGKVRLRAAHIQITDHIILGVLREQIEKGEVTPKHFELETQCMPSWNPVSKALEDGTVDCAFVLAPIAMDLFHYKTPIKLVLFAHKNGSIFVRNAMGEYTDPYQNFFKGKSFLIPHKMSIHHMLTHMFFTRVGLKASLEKGSDVQVNLEIVPPVKMPEFLADNPNNSGFLVAEPIGSKSVAAGIAKRQFLSSELWKDHPCCIVAMRDEFVAAHAEAVQEFTNLLVQAGLFVARQPAKAAETAVRFLDPGGQLGLKVPVLEKVLSDPLGITTDDLYPNVEDLERIQRYMHDEMHVGNLIDLGSFVDPRFAEVACRDTGVTRGQSYYTDAEAVAMELLARGGSGDSSASRNLVSKEGKYLTFSLGNQEFGVDILRVKEIIGKMDIISLPQAHRYIKGVINLRDRVIPVMDLRRRFALEEIEGTSRSCIVILEGGVRKNNSLVGMTVDSVSEVLNIRSADIDDATSFAKKVDTSYVLAMAKVGEKVKILLNIDQVLNF